MTLISDLHDGVLTLTLNRPNKLNAINNDLALRLLDALRAAAADPGVRVVRLRGNGRAFCAGRDVSEPPTERDLELVQAVAQAIVRLPQPVVADGTAGRWGPVSNGCWMRIWWWLAAVHAFACRRPRWGCSSLGA